MQYTSLNVVFMCLSFFFQAEDGIRDLVRSRGLGDVYKRQLQELIDAQHVSPSRLLRRFIHFVRRYWDHGAFIDLSLIHI